MLIAGADRRVLEAFATKIGKHLHVMIGDGPFIMVLTSFRLAKA
jgi:hypothetical protein